MNSSETNLTDYLVNELDERQREALEAELREDSAMADELKGLEETAGMVQSALDAETYAFSPGELASLRQQVGLPPVEEGANVFHLGRALWRGSAWVGAAAACVAAMFWLVDQNDGTSIAAGDDSSSNHAAGGPSSQVLLAPVAFAADPGAGEAKPELIGVPELLVDAWPEPDQVAKLRSPDLTRINKPTVLQLSMKVGDGSYEALKSHVLDQSKLPPLGMIRIDELSNVFADDIAGGVSLNHYQHPWRESGEILLASLPATSSEASLLAEGHGTLRLFGEQSLDADQGEFNPVSLSQLKANRTRVWFLEGNLSGMSFELRGGGSSLRTDAQIEPLAWQESSASVRASMLLIGLGEYLRGSGSAPSEAQLLMICESLRAQSADIDRKFLDAVMLTEVSIRLRNGQ